MSVRRFVSQSKKVFAHVYRMPDEICSSRVKSLTAISEEGEEFLYEADQTRYFESAWEMWEAFCAFCRKLGMRRGCDELWYSESVCERFDGQAVPCEECKPSNCFFLRDYLESLGCWETMYMEYEYPKKCIHLAHPVSFEDFKKQCGYDVGKEPYAGRDLYRRFSAEIDKEKFTGQECERMAQYIADNRAQILADTEQCVDIFLRLWKNAPVLYERSYRLLFAGYDGRSEEEREELDRFADWLTEERRIIHKDKE